jgi:hypothetical protein
MLYDRELLFLVLFIVWWRQVTDTYLSISRLISKCAHKFLVIFSCCPCCHVLVSRKGDIVLNPNFLQHQVSLL